MRKVIMYKISLITGDGIGPEVSASAVSVLETINDKLGLKFEITKLQAGDQALKETGKALPDVTILAGVSVMVDSGAVLTINPEVTLTIPSGENIIIKNGSGVLIKSGGTLQVNS